MKELVIKVVNCTIPGKGFHKQKKSKISSVHTLNFAKFTYPEALVQKMIVHIIKCLYADKAVFKEYTMMIELL